MIGQFFIFIFGSFQPNMILGWANTWLTITLKLPCYTFILVLFVCKNIYIYMEYILFKFLYQKLYTVENEGKK